MAARLLTYSLIRTLYDEGKDYIDSFWPFALVAIAEARKRLELRQVRTAVADRYGLENPEHSLSVILTRAKRRGLLTQQKRQYSLTEAGATYASRMESEVEVNRRVNELLEDARLHLQRNGDRRFSAEETGRLLEAFVADHIEVFVDFVDPSRAVPGRVVRDRTLREVEGDLLDYFELVESRKPALLTTLRDIICGSIISSILGSRSLADATQKFGTTVLYLDTNFLFSLFELHFVEYSRPAKELLALIRQERRFDLRVFDFTVEEFVGVLRGYQREQHRYVPQVRVDSVYSSIKAKGWGSADVREFIMRIEEKLWGEGIKVQASGVRVAQWDPGEERRRSLEKYKPDQARRGQGHDLAAIEQVAKARGRTTRKIEECRAMFVTSDVRLARYNAVEGGHRDTLTVSEVVLDRVLTNLLWLKSPTLIKSLPLASIIAVHSRELFVDRGVWERFVETLRSLRERGRVSEEEVSVLLYDHGLAEMLRVLTRDEAGRITPEFVAKALEAAQGRRGALLEGRVAGERAAMERELAGARHEFDAEMARAEQEMMDKLLGALEEAKASLRKRAGSHAKRVHRGGLAVVALILCGLSIWLTPKVIESWNTIEPAAWLVGILWGPLIAYLGYRKDWFGVGERLRARLFQMFYQRMLRGAEIERLEARIRGVGDGKSRGVRE